MRRAFFLIAALLPLTARGEAPDHTNPPALNEYAIARVKEGDTATALILLERAARLSPGDERIRHNLEVLRGWTGEGEIVVRTEGRGEEGAAVPALWE